MRAEQPNSFQPKRERRHTPFKEAQALAPVQRLIDKRDELGKMSDEEKDKFKGDFASLIYRANPFVVDLLTVEKSLHEYAEKIKFSGQISQKNIAVLEMVDNFSHKIGGLSLDDLEKMDVNEEGLLGIGDAKRINRMLQSWQHIRFIGKKLNMFKRSEREEMLITELIIFSVQPLVRPEVKIPNSLVKLHRNLRTYLDVYAQGLSGELGPTDEKIILNRIFLQGKWFISLASNYIPAYFGITPSSAIKLYQQREVFADSPILRISWHKINSIFKEDAKKAYKNDSLPEDLQAYQYYDETADNKASEILSKYYNHEHLTRDKIFASKPKAEDLTSHFIQEDFAKILKDVSRQPNGRINLSIQNSAIDNITITAQRQSKKTIIFLLHLSNNSHLALEIDRKGRLFGLPTILIKTVPQIEDLLKIDILNLLAEQRPKRIKLTPLPKLPVVSRAYVQALVQPSESSKKRRLHPSLSAVEIDEVENVLSPARKTVFYSEELIKEFLHGKKTSVQDIERIIGTLRRFEEGWLRGESIKFSQGELIKLRTGDFRVGLKILGDSNYELVGIGDREDFYERLELKYK